MRVPPSCIVSWPSPLLLLLRLAPLNTSTQVECAEGLASEHQEVTDFVYQGARWPTTARLTGDGLPAYLRNLPSRPNMQGRWVQPQSSGLRVGGAP